MDAHCAPCPLKTKLIKGLSVARTGFRGTSERPCRSSCAEDARAKDFQGSLLLLLLNVKARSCRYSSENFLPGWFRWLSRAEACRCMPFSSAALNRNNNLPGTVLEGSRQLKYSEGALQLALETVLCSARFARLCR